MQAREAEERELDARPTKASGLAPAVLPPPPANGLPPAVQAAAKPAAPGEKRRHRWDQSGGADACAPAALLHTWR